VGLIIPWNFPLLMAAWKLAPALACGNTCLLKPAEETPLTALRLGELIGEAGFPAGAVNILTGPGVPTGAALTTHAGVDKVAFTGSTEVGRKIMQASAISNLKRVSLELGGKSPNVIFLKEQAERIRPGNGLAPKVHIGPIVSQTQLDRVVRYVETGKQAGVQVVTGGERLGGELANGYFLQPTIFAHEDDSLEIVQEEIFGPVVAATPFNDWDELIQRANDSRYGLAAGVWTQDIGKAHRFAQAIKAGVVWVNTYGLFDAAAPFGGYRESGFGREMGKDALELYTQVKTVWINMA
jgi:acyl-CoA reductase-like NAD-dependent aldehyde dehydrogenase